MEDVQETESDIMIYVSFKTSVYALYGCVFSYKAKLIFKESSWIIGLSKAPFESGALFYWMRWSLNLISLSNHACFVMLQQFSNPEILNFLKGG